MVDDHRHELSRRKTLAYAGSSVLTAGLAGCTGSSGDGNGNGNGNGGGSGGGPIKFGLVGPLDAALTQSTISGLEVAVNEINQNGGIFDRQVEIITRDSQYDPSTGIEMYQRLVHDDEVHLTGGYVLSEAMLAAMDPIADAQKIHLNFVTGTPAAAEMLADDYERYKYWFRVGPLNGFNRGAEQARFANNSFEKFGFERIGLLFEDYEWTNTISDGIDDVLDFEGEVVYSNRFDAGTSDFSPLFDELESKNVDVVIAALGHVGIDMTLQWARQERDFAVTGVNVLAEQPNFCELVEGECTGMGGSSYGGYGEGLINGQVTADFIENYRESDGHLGYPTVGSWPAYDGLHMYKQAVEEAGTLDEEEVIPIFRDMSYDATYGTVEFYDQDHKWPHDLKRGQDYVSEVQYQWQPTGDDGHKAVAIGPQWLDGVVDYRSRDEM